MNNQDEDDDDFKDSDLKQPILDFINWVSLNDFTDPENMLVCAEWHNLCGAVGEPMRMAGSQYEQRQKELAELIRIEDEARSQ